MGLLRQEQGKERLQGVMHGIGIIWHLTIHLSMTPCGLDWLETDPQTSNVHAFAYGHESSRQLRKYTWALPVSDMYFQLEHCYTAQETYITRKPTGPLVWTECHTFLQSPPQSREPTSRQLHQRCKRKLVTIIDN